MEFKLHLLETITDNFSEKKRVGSGAYGTVYKGVHNGKEIAVKKLHPFLGLDDKDFDNEFRNLSKVHHENVVQLIGYCYESRRIYVEHNGELIITPIKERILCFDYMQGGSLDEHITDESCDLDWPMCYKIIIGTCEGLNHLHSAHDKPIFHMNLKPSNILLDENMTAKIADLGLSRLVYSTTTHKIEISNMSGTFGYMPSEYIDVGDVSKKFDVYSLGAIIIRIMDGNNGHAHFSEMGPDKFIENVIGNWERRLMETSRYASHKKDILQMKTCVEIALRCVEKDRNKRPSIKDIVHKLEELEVEIKKMSLYSDHSKDLIGQTGSGSSVLSVDPSQELRFLFEQRKDVSTCLQLTNKTNDFIAFSVKTNKRKYCAQPNTGVMPPCSKRYMSVTLRAQEEAPPNMQCHDMFVVMSARVSEDLTSDEITDDFLEEGKVDMMKLPIVYVATDQFPSSNVFEPRKGVSADLDKAEKAGKHAIDIPPPNNRPILQLDLPRPFIADCNLHLYQDGSVRASLGAMRPLVGKLDMLLLAPPQGCFSESVKDKMQLLKEDVEEISSCLDEAICSKRGPLSPRNTIAQSSATLAR